jgi:hypothetical protein
MYKIDAKNLGYTSGRGAMPDEQEQSPPPTSVTVTVPTTQPQPSKDEHDPGKILARKLAKG